MVLSLLSGGSAHVWPHFDAPVAPAYTATSLLADDLQVPRVMPPDAVVQAEIDPPIAAPAPPSLGVLGPAALLIEPEPQPRAPRVEAPPPGPTAAEMDWDRPHSNWLDAPAADLTVSLGDYRDCGGSTPLHGAARDWCATSLVYLVGHNPGLFTPLLRLKPGDLVRYWDPSGNFATYRLDHIDRVPSSAGSQYMTDTARPHLTMQTCVDPSGSQYWMYVAYPV